MEDSSFDLSLLSKVPSWIEEVVVLEHHRLHTLNYIFCSDDYLLNINRAYLQHDYYTDIITFDQRDHQNEALEGDIFISVDRVAENSQERQSVMLHELLRVMIHGVLHLIGYDDKDEATQTMMRALEDRYLALYFSRS